MNPGGDAAEQVVRMSLETMEVAAKISGQGAKLIALRLAATLKEEQKTKGKARLTSMLKSGKPLKVYEVRQKDLTTFAKEAKRYGVLYCVLKDKNNKDENAMVDIISRVEDASKIQRITDKFKLVTQDTASVISKVEMSREQKSNEREMTPGNPFLAKAENAPLSKPDYATQSAGEMSPENERPSVKAKLQKYQMKVNNDKEERARERSMDHFHRSTELPKKLVKDDKGR